MTTVDELEQKIKEGEVLLAQERVSGWMPLVGSLFITFYMCRIILRGNFYLILAILALLYVGFNIWRVIKAQMNVRKLEAKILDYRDQKARLEKSGS